MIAVGLLLANFVLYIMWFVDYIHHNYQNSDEVMFCLFVLLCLIIAISKILHSIYVGVTFCWKKSGEYYDEY